MMLLMLAYFSTLAVFCVCFNLVLVYCGVATLNPLHISTALTGSAAFLLLCGYLGTSTVTAVLFLTVALTFSTMMVVGANSNHLDIAPKYAGVIFGVTNLANTLPGIIGTQVAKAIAVEVGHYMPAFSYSNTADSSLICSLMLQ